MRPGRGGPPRSVDHDYKEVRKSLDDDTGERFQEDPTTHGEDEEEVEVFGSLPRDDDRARQFLRLAELEGLSPLHCALGGLTLLDELRDAAEGDPDSPEGRFAKELIGKQEAAINELSPLRSKPLHED